MCCSLRPADTHLLILLPQLSSILRFFIYKNLKLARSRAYALTVSSRGKPHEFWSQVGGGISILAVMRVLVSADMLCPGVHRRMGVAARSQSGRPRGIASEQRSKVDLMGALVAHSAVLAAL